MDIARSVMLFGLAGLAEIGGGYLMWLWLREGRPLWVGIVGAVVIVLYGIIPTLQPASLGFGRVYASYGGAFIVLSLLWGWDCFDNAPVESFFSTLKTELVDQQRVATRQEARRAIFE